MTSTLGVWILTGYGAEKAPRLMQFSVHCDHLRSISFRRADPLTLRRKGDCFDHPAPKKDVLLNIRPRERTKLLWFASFFHHTEKRKRFCSGVFKNISPIYGHERGRNFYGLPAFFTIRRNMGRFDQPFTNFFFTLRYTEKNMLF